jgi:hypothetical protein
MREANALVSILNVANARGFAPHAKRLLARTRGLR